MDIVGNVLQFRFGNKNWMLKWDKCSVRPAFDKTEYPNDSS